MRAGACNENPLIHATSISIEFAADEGAKYYPLIISGIPPSILAYLIPAALSTSLFKFPIPVMACLTFATLKKQIMRVRVRG